MVQRGHVHWHFMLEHLKVVDFFSLSVSKHFFNLHCPFAPSFIPLPVCLCVCARVRLCVCVCVCPLQQALLSPLVPPPFLWASCSSTPWPSRGSTVRPWPPPHSHSRDSRLSSASLLLSPSQVTCPACCHLYLLLLTATKLLLVLPLLPWPHPKWGLRMLL